MATDYRRQSENVNQHGGGADFRRWKGHQAVKILNLSRRSLKRKLGDWGVRDEAGMLVQIGESSATVTPYGPLAHVYHSVGNMRGGHGGAVGVWRRICKILLAGWV